MISLNRNFCVLLFSAALICACARIEPGGENGTGETLADGVSVTFCLQANPVDPLTRSVEDSYSHVQGTADEYQVNKARVYFYDSSTKLFAKSFLLSGLKRSGSDASGNIVYEAEHVQVPQGTYDIFVVANSDRVISQENEADFLADVDKNTYAKGAIDDISAGVVMTNRAVDNLGTVIAKKSGNSNDDVVIKIVLERVLARLDIGKREETFSLTDKNSKLYARVTPDGYYVVNLARHYYSFRHTAVLNSLEEPEWSLPTNFGNVSDIDGYVVDPYFFNKKINATNFTNADKFYEHFYGEYNGMDSAPWTAFKPVSETPQYNTIYCLDNCTLAPAQKNGYSTGIVFKAILEPYNNVYHLNADGSLVLITDKNKYPEVIYYFNYNFYDSPEALAAAIGISSISGVDLDQYQVRTYMMSDEGYRCYYTYWIRHQDNYKNTVMGVMEFAVVRNNLYRILISDVSALGDANVDVDPDLPDEGQTYLKVVLNVKPWIVRDLTNIVL